MTIVPLDECCGGGIYDYTLINGGRTAGDVKTAGNFSTFQVRRWLGEYSNIYRVVNTAGDIYGSATSTAPGIQGVDDGNTDHKGNYIYFYGLDKDNPMLVRSGAGLNGIQLGTKKSGAVFVFQNIVVDSPGSSGMSLNYGLGGGSYYKSIEASHIRVFNAAQEGFYFGQTTTGFDKFENLTIHDCLSYNSIREGFQTEHVDNLLCYNNTVILSGQGGVSQQNGLFQIHDVNGLLCNNIYDGAPAVGTAFTHGTTVRNCYFRYTDNTEQYFIGKAATTYFGGSSRLNGRPLLFDSCTFHLDNVGTIAFFANVAETDCDIEFRRCTFSPNILALYNDTRSTTKNNRLIGAINANGNTSAAITAPVYGPNYSLYSASTAHGLCISPAYQNLAMGYRTRRSINQLNAYRMAA